jgi:hypothetical protein
MAALRSAYQRGQRYLKLLQAGSRPWRCDQCRTVLKEGVHLQALSKIDPGFRIADTLANECGIDRKQVREDCYFAAAVDTIAAYCGDEARDLILQDHQDLDRKTVLQISRTAPTRQQYAMERVRQGRCPLATDGKGCQVYDTVDFKEILSRLRRAQGKIAACVFILDRLAVTQPSKREATVVRARLDDIRIEVSQILRAVQLAPEGTPCPCDLARMKKDSRKQPKRKKPLAIPADHYGVVGLLNQAQSWTGKCAHDLPELLQQVLPIWPEKEEVRARGELVLKAVESLLRLTAPFPRPVPLALPPLSG